MSDSVATASVATGKFSEPNVDRYTLSALAPGGHFGLHELRDYTETVLEPYFQAKTEILFILDFSLVKMWDVSALLWLTIALHHYRRRDIRFQLRLPEPRIAVSPKETEELQRSSDYLRRWQFDVALQNLVRDVNDILVPDQFDYFHSRHQRYYLPTKIRLERNVQDSLISRRLVGIRNLVEIVSLAPHEISEKLIAECIASFQSARMGDILNVQCGIDKRVADLFADHLLTESLMNVKEHPNATVGLMAVSVNGLANELILTVADNGDSICSTIFEAFCLSKQIDYVSYNEREHDDKTRASIIDFATQPGISRKPRSDARKVGMGLTYIKEDTVKTFRGKFRIIADSVSIRYPEEEARSEYSFDPWPHPWRGNLLRISIPLKRKPEISVKNS